ncbi:MAG: hypothetical protein QOC81_5014 [Thermoanaerobaculia bacterium]|jgi:hypothetical protein|nr:hypothetical protein [Thermoanaerobaculia bacterium]
MTNLDSSSPTLEEQPKASRTGFFRTDSRSLSRCTTCTESRAVMPFSSRAFGLCSRASAPECSTSSASGNVGFRYAGGLLERFDRVTVMLGGDDAGRQARNEAVGKLTRVGIERVEAVDLPASMRPDMLSPDELRSLLGVLPEFEGLLEVIEPGLSGEAMSACAAKIQPSFLGGFYLAYTSQVNERSSKRGIHFSRQSCNRPR